MRDILVLERLVSRIVKDCSSGLVLCGKKDCLKLANRDNDVLFHLLKDVPYERLKDEDFFFVPVIEGNPYEKIYEINKQNSFFSTYAARATKPKICEFDGKKEIVEGTFLEFFDVQQGSAGLIVDSRKDYFTASEKDFRQNFNNYKDVLYMFKKFRSQLKRKYGC